MLLAITKILVPNIPAPSAIVSLQSGVELTCAYERRLELFRCVCVVQNYQRTPDTGSSEHEFNVLDSVSSHDSHYVAILEASSKERSCSRVASCL